MDTILKYDELPEEIKKKMHLHWKIPAAHLRKKTRVECECGT